MQPGKIFKCNSCEFTVEVVNSSCDCEECEATLSCCGDAMLLMQAKASDAGKEKHVPVLVKHESGVKVTVGSVAHPMQDDHYIEWIEVINGPYVNRKHLKPGEAPEAAFYVPEQPGLQVRAYCNKHGLWQG